MIYFIYPRLRKLSGAERLILRLASYIAQRGVPVTLVTHYFDARCAPALASQVQLAQTGARLNYSTNHYLNAPFEYLHSLRLLRYIGRDAEAVTFFGPPSLPALAWFSVRRNTRARGDHLSRSVGTGAGAPLLYFCYEPPRFIYDDAAQVTARMGAGGMLARPFFGLYKMLDRAMVRRADALLANSQFGAARLRAAYGRAATVITHGADFAPAPPEQARAVRAQYALEDKFVLLTVNFLHPRKRIDLFLRACAELKTRVPDAAALVVGAGPENDALQKLARELQLADTVRFTGFVPDEMLPAFYAASDLYVHTCKNESFGLSVLEASAAGLPVIAVNEGGPREILYDGETGLLTEATAGAIASAADSLAHDAARRKQMGAAGRRRAAALYSWERGAQDFLDAFKSLRFR